MTRIVIFRPGEDLPDELEDWPDAMWSRYLPVGTWYWHTGDWYYVHSMGKDPIEWQEPSQVPADFKIRLLLLGVS